MKIKISPFWKTFSAYDKISLISQFYDGCENQTDSVYIILIDSKEAQEYVENKPHFFGVKDIKTTKDLANNQVLKFINDKEILQLKEYLQMQIFHVEINWNKLHEVAGQYHDFEAPKPYGIIQQEKIMRKIILEKAERLNINEFDLTEKDLGSYIAEMVNENKYSYDNSPDCHIQFITSIVRLERNGFIKILGFDFNFGAERTLFEKILEHKDYVYPIKKHVYYPAEHCCVLIKLNKNHNKSVNKFIEPSSNKLDQTGPFQKEYFKIVFKKTTYDPKTATLILNGIKIQMPPYTNQDRLCKVMFSSKNNMKKYWSWDEIIVHKGWNQPEFTDDKSFWRRIYNAAGEVNIKIAVKTGIEDFFIKTPIGTLKINPLRLP